MRDDNGTDRIQIGLLDDGTYDVAVINPSTGAIVKLSTMAFGSTVATIGTRESTASNSYTALATAGPVVTATIGTSGRCIVMASMFLEIVDPAGSAVDSAAAYMSYDVSGPTASSAIDGRAAAIFFKYDKTGPVEDTAYEVQMGATRVSMLTGLTAGSYTFTAKYRVINSHSSFFSDRVLVVIPY